MTVRHPALDKPITHTDMLSGISLTAILKQFNLPGKLISELRHYGTTSFEDEYGATHLVELKKEAN